jgi:PAS domain S-box-containing protein
MDDQNIRPQDLGIGRLFERVRDAVIVAETTGKILLWNPAATEIFGYSSAEALEMNVEVLVPDHLKELHQAGLSRYRKTGHGRYIDSAELLELPARRKDGTQLWIEMSLNPIEPPNEIGLDGEASCSPSSATSARERSWRSNWLTEPCTTPSRVCLTVRFS